MIIVGGNQATIYVKISSTLVASYQTENLTAKQARKLASDLVAAAKRSEAQLKQWHKDVS